MTSLQTTTKQVGAATAYYIPLADIRSEIFSYRTDINRFSTAVWSAGTPAGQGRFSSLVATGTTLGTGLLKDMGKTVVSSTYTFRKVQLVVPNAGLNSTFGVAGDSGSVTGDYLTGYIAIGVEGGSGPTRVAKYGL
jgi:hypothetical protein